MLIFKLFLFLPENAVIMGWSRFLTKFTREFKSTWRRWGWTSTTRISGLLYPSSAPILWPSWWSSSAGSLLTLILSILRMLRSTFWRSLILFSTKRQPSIWDIRQLLRKPTESLIRLNSATLLSRKNRLWRWKRKWRRLRLVVTWVRFWLNLTTKTLSRRLKWRVKVLLCSWADDHQAQ